MRRLIALAALVALVLSISSETLALPDGYGFSPRERGVKTPFFLFHGALTRTTPVSSSADIVVGVVVPIDVPGRIIVKMTASISLLGSGFPSAGVRLDGTSLCSVGPSAPVVGNTMSCYLIIDVPGRIVGAASADFPALVYQGWTWNSFDAIAVQIVPTALLPSPATKTSVRISPSISGSAFTADVSLNYFRIDLEQDRRQ